MALPRYNLNPRYSLGNDAFAQYFKETLADFGHDERLNTTSPTITLCDSISRSASPSSTAGTAVEENMTFGTFGSKDLGSDSEASDSDDESEDGDGLMQDASRFEVRDDGRAYLLPGDDHMLETRHDETMLMMDEHAASFLEEAENEVDDLPFIPSSSMDFRHTSLAPPPSASLLPPASFPTSTSRSDLRVRLGPSEVDGDYESDGVPSDDEYRPSPPPSNPRKRPHSSRASPRSARRHAPYPAPSLLPSQNKRPRAPPPSRNKQASDVDLSTYDPTDFKCPVCDWVQGNQRKPDFLRHLSTHTRASNKDQSKGWWCKGVRMEDLHEYNRSALDMGRKIISRDAEVIQFRDHVRIGGCLLSFSRRDALKRHLDNPGMACAGYACKAMDEC